MVYFIWRISTKKLIGTLPSVVTIAWVVVLSAFSSGLLVMTPPVVDVPVALVVVT